MRSLTSISCRRVSADATTRPGVRFALTDVIHPAVIDLGVSVATRDSMDTSSQIKYYQRKSPSWALHLKWNVKRVLSSLLQLQKKRLIHPGMAPRSYSQATSPPLQRGAQRIFNLSMSQGKLGQLVTILLITQATSHCQDNIWLRLLRILELRWPIEALWPTWSHLPIVRLEGGQMLQGYRDYKQLNLLYSYPLEKASTLSSKGSLRSGKKQILRKKISGKSNTLTTLSPNISPPWEVCST